MTSGAILSRTPSLGLAKLRFNFPNWGDEHNRNLEIVDAALQVVGVVFDGAWTNDTSFAVGSKVIDSDNATFWRALVAHTSPNSGTFSEARAAEPTHWEEIINVINFRGEWADATAYQLNDIVFSGYKWAIAVVTHTSATSFATGVADGNLEIFFDGTTTVTDAEAAATAAGTSETNASTFATNASNSASAAAQSAIDAANEVAAALIHRNKAEQWAEEAEDVAVETGQFSAKHHRIKAAVHESEAKDARDEAVNRLENAAGAVRHDVVQTLTSGEQQQALANIGAGVLAGFRNKIINGDFLFWQRGTSITDLVYDCDRWASTTGNGSFTVSRQAFTPGQTDVPGEPRFFRRHQQTVAADNPHSIARHRIEDARTLAGKKATLTFYAKAPNAKEFFIAIQQRFGSGGGSGSETALVQTWLGTGEWTKYQFVFDFPSIEGKTFGPNEDSDIQVQIGEDTDFSTFTVDIAHVSLVEGDATAEVDPFTPRHPQQELSLCERYFQKSYSLNTTPGTVTQQGMVAWQAVSNGIYGRAIRVEYRSRMRAIPSVTIYSPETGASGKVFRVSFGDVDGSPNGSTIGDAGMLAGVTSNDDLSPSDYVRMQYTLDAEL